MLTVLRRHRDFRFVLSAQVLNNLGSWLLLIAAPYYVLRLTGSVLSTGLAFAVESVPAILVGPFAGVLVDRFDRRTTMVVADIGRAAAVLAMLFARDRGHLWVIYAALVVESALTQANLPARSALVPQIVGRGADLPAANALAETFMGAVQLVGAPVGGALYLAWGFDLVVVADAVSYLGSAALLLCVPRRGQLAATAERGFRAVLADIGVGVRALAGRRDLRVLTLAGGLFLMGNGIANALLVAYLGKTLGLHALGVGALLAVFGAGYLVGAPFAPRLVERLPPRLVVIGGLAGVAACFAVAFDVHLVAVVGLAFLALGPPAVLFLVGVDTLIARAAPDHVLGRVFAGYRTATRSAALVGEVGGAAAGGVLGVVPALNIGVLLVLAGASAGLLLPRRAAPPVR